jgi:hypothetical protein
MDEETDGITTTQKIAMPDVKYFPTYQQEESINWLYEGGFNTETVKNCSVLSVTNTDVDKWNTFIQKRNLTQELPITLESHDKIAEVDDDNKFLAACLPDYVLNDFTNPSVAPPHLLQLKVITTNTPAMIVHTTRLFSVVLNIFSNNLFQSLCLTTDFSTITSPSTNASPPFHIFLQVNDICLIIRPLKASGLATNSRVRIMRITPRLITAETVEEIPRVVFIPRIRFKFSLKYGASFKMLRTQFPLRLAYSMTYNKGQGQTFHKTLLDITTSPFAHGHLYVGDSRVRSSNNIRFFLDDSYQTTLIAPDEYAGYNVQFHEELISVPVITNVVHRSILQKLL